MEFAKDEQLHQWKTRVVVQGKRVPLSIDCSYAESSLPAIVDQTLGKLAQAWPQIQANIVRSLHRLYNDAWAVPEEGFPRMSADDFLNKIILSAVEVMEEEALALYFSDSGIFAGHSVEIFWNSDGRIYPATIIG